MFCRQFERVKRKKIFVKHGQEEIKQQAVKKLAAGCSANNCQLPVYTISLEEVLIAFSGFPIFFGALASLASVLNVNLES